MASANYKLFLEHLMCEKLCEFAPGTVALQCTACNQKLPGARGGPEGQGRNSTRGSLLKNTGNLPCVAFRALFRTMKWGGQWGHTQHFLREQLKSELFIPTDGSTYTPPKKK